MSKQYRIIAAALLCMLAISSSALAEVCDKAVGEGWRPAHGPVWLLNPASSSWFTLALQTALLLAALIVRNRILANSAAAFFFTSAILLLAMDVMPSHDIYLMQLKEGCRSVRTDLMDAGLRFAAGAACLAAGNIFRQRAGAA